MKKNKILFIYILYLCLCLSFGLNKNSLKREIAYDKEAMKDFDAQEGSTMYEFDDLSQVPQWLLNGDSEPPLDSDINSMSITKPPKSSKELLITRSYEQEAEERKKYKKADELYSQSNFGGEYDFQEYLNFTFFVRIQSKSFLNVDTSATGDKFVQRLVNVNRNAIYVFGGAANSRDFKDKDYRDDHIVSIELSSLYSKESGDNLEMNLCCQRIKSISNTGLFIGQGLQSQQDMNGGMTKQVTSTIGSLIQFEGSKQTVVRCFRLNGMDYIWSICSQSIKQLVVFRSQLILHVLYSVQKVINHALFIVNPFIQVGYDFDVQVDIDTSSNPDSIVGPGASGSGSGGNSIVGPGAPGSGPNPWGGLCMYGQQQSPIDIVSTLKGGQVLRRDMTMTFDWKPTQATLKWNGAEMELHGQYGNLIFQYDGAPSRKFTAYMIKFKIGTEHKIYDEEYKSILEQKKEDIFKGKKTDTQTPKGDKLIDYNDSIEENDDDVNEFVGEVLVYMKDTDGVLAIASFMLKFNPTTANYQGKNFFFENLEYSSWQQKEGWNYVLQRAVNLDTIYKKYSQLYFPKDVYYYVGSDSVPPCYEGVMRFVFKHPVYLNDMQFESLRMANLRPGSGSNIRNTQPYGKRTIYYANDYQNKCDGYEEFGANRPNQDPLFDLNGKPVLQQPQSQIQLPLN